MFSDIQVSADISLLPGYPKFAMFSEKCRGQGEIQKILSKYFLVAFEPVSYVIDATNYRTYRILRTKK